MEKRNKIIYWVCTALVCFGMLGSGVQQILRTSEMTLMLNGLGYPTYFGVLIGVWKVLAVITLLLPNFKLVKEWAYAGLFFTMTGALFSHLACGHFEIKEIAGPVMQTLFIVASWYFRPADRKLNAA